MRYFIRNASGEELVVPSLSDLHDLYANGFLDDGDLVRSESSELWTKAGRMPALSGVRLRRREPGRLLLLALAAAAFTGLIALLLAR